MPDNRSYLERVDDTILVTAGQLAKLRGITVRGALADFRQSCVEVLADSIGSPDEGIWRTRIDRCDALAGEPDDDRLRRAVVAAREHER